MKKVLVISLVLSALLFGTAWASPLMDYEAGRGSIDLNWRSTGMNVTGYTHANLPDNYNLDAAITFGLGNNFAFQYRNFEPKSPVVTPWNFNGVLTSGQFTFSSQEFNVLYKLGKDVSAFAGDVSAHGYRWTPISTYTTAARNLWQIGITGRSLIAPKTTLWASAAAGTDLTNLEIGVSYEFTHNTEFNFSYRKIDTKNLKVYQISENVKSTGFGYGITYKF